jgi:GTP-sensing pleiotropic transcriptional regulator CodY
LCEEAPPLAPHPLIILGQAITYEWNSKLLTNSSIDKNVKVDFNRILLTCTTQKCNIKIETNVSEFQFMGK